MSDRPSWVFLFFLKNKRFFNQPKCHIRTGFCLRNKTQSRLEICGPNNWGSVFRIFGFGFKKTCFPNKASINIFFINGIVGLVFVNFVGKMAKQHPKGRMGQLNKDPNTKQLSSRKSLKTSTKLVK
jgi:hypothetical protein